MIDLFAGEKESFLSGQRVQAVAIDYRILPVAVLSPAGILPTGQTLHTRLQPGQHLIGIIALTDLERLLHRQPTPAAYTVEVTAFPLSARAWLADMVRALRKVSAEDAQALLEQMPLPLESGLTRGQAEDLLARLNRERISAQVKELEPAGAR